MELLLNQHYQYHAILCMAGVIKANRKSKQYKKIQKKILMYTKNWNQDQRRLKKFGESDYKDTLFILDLKEVFITYLLKEPKFIANAVA